MFAELFKFNFKNLNFCRFYIKSM